VGDADLPSAVEDLIRVINTLIEIDEGDRDENGFSMNWDGALARIKKEFDFSFSYGPLHFFLTNPLSLSRLCSVVGPPEGESYSIDTVELKVKLEDVAQMTISYGEYLSPDDREGYVELFLEHILRAAKGWTLLPLFLSLMPLLVFRLDDGPSGVDLQSWGQVCGPSRQTRRSVGLSPDHQLLEERVDRREGDLQVPRP
jgi:hypothetical protein